MTKLKKYVNIILYLVKNANRKEVWNMEKEKNVTFDEYTLLCNHMYKLHNETKEEFKAVNSRLDKMDSRLDNVDSDLRIIKNLLLQMVENNGLKAVK